VRLIEFDRRLFFWINGWQNPFLDYVLTWPTYLANFQILLAIALTGMFLFDRKHWLKRGIFFTVSLLAVYLAMELLKIAFSRPRPFDVFIADVIFHPGFEKPETYSFPSGHATLAFAAAVLINALYPRRKFFLLYFLAVWICLTRIYLGFHYPSDVLAGAILGASCAFFECKIFPLRPTT